MNEDIVERLESWVPNDHDLMLILDDAADEIDRLRVEVGDLKRINMNLRYLIPEGVWMDEADRLRGDNQGNPAAYWYQQAMEVLREEVER